MDDEFCSIIIMATKSQAEIMENVTTLESMLPETYHPFLQRIREILMRDTVHLEEVCAQCDGGRAAMLSEETRDLINGVTDTSNIRFRDQ